MCVILHIIWILRLFTLYWQLMRQWAYLPKNSLNKSRHYPNGSVCYSPMLCLWNKNSNLNGNNWNYHILLYDWNDITWWRHQMETFSALLALCTGNSPVTGKFPSQRPMTRNFVVYFDLRLNKRLSKWWGWDLRRHRAHHDVTVIKDQYVTGVRSLDMRVFFR